MPRIRVATYNLYLGADLSMLMDTGHVATLEERLEEVQRQLRTTAFPGRAEAVARVLVREQVDLVGLQEVCTWHADGVLQADYTAALQDELDTLGEPYDLVVEQPTFSGAGTVEVGGREVELHLLGRNAVLRRRAAPVTVQSVDQGLYGDALQVTVMGSMDVSIARGWCSATCVADGAAFTFVTTHTEAYDAGSRDRQRTELLTVLPDDLDPLVMVGDFNATPDQVGMPEQLADAWLLAGNDPEGGATCCQGPDLTNADSTLTERIDYVWVRGVGVDRCAVVGASVEDRTASGLWPSDHAGVVAELLLGK